MASCTDTVVDPQTHWVRQLSNVTADIMGHQWDMLRIREGNTILYRAYAETRDATGASRLDCNHIRVSRDAIILHLGEQLDLLHFYGLVRDTAGHVVAVQQFLFNERDGRIYWESPLHGIQFTYGRNTDRRTTVCWHADTGSWWISGESRRRDYGPCEREVSNQRRITVASPGR